MLIYKYNTYHFKISLRSHIFSVDWCLGFGSWFLEDFYKYSLVVKLHKLPWQLVEQFCFQVKYIKLFEKILFSKIAEPHISGFIIFDTQMIMTRVSPEEYVIATIELYLDIINLFLEILKILDKINRK